MLRDDQLALLSGLPTDWRFCLTGSHEDAKVAFEDGWNQTGRGHSLDDVVRINCMPTTYERWLSRKVLGLGVLSGPESGGLLVIDFDGRGSEAVRTFWQVFGRSPRELPQTLANTSGKRGRGKVFLQVPPEWWPQLENRSASWRIGERVVLEAIWQNGTGTSRHAVVTGDHPDSSHQAPLFFRWLPGRSPQEVGWAHAPDWLLLGLVARFRETDGGRTAQEIRRAGEDDPTPWQLLLTVERLELARAALEFCPTRDGLGSGTYEKVRRILCGLIHEFGTDLAVDIVCNSQWNTKCDWGPGRDAVKVIGSLAASTTQDGAKASIRSLFHFAREGGYVWPRWALPPADPRQNVDGIRKLLNLMNKEEDDPVAIAAYEGQARRDYGVDRESLYRLRLEHHLGQAEGRRVLTLSEIAARGRTDEVDVLDGFLARRVHVIAGGSHSGKTTLSCFLANRVIHGHAVIVDGVRHSCERPGRVLVLTSDCSDADMVRDLALEGVDPNDAEDRLKIWSGASFADMLSIVRLLEQFRPDLVVMDCLTSMAVPGTKIGDPAYADPIRMLVRHNGVAWPKAAFCILHHTTRDEPTRFSGTEQVKAAAEELLLYYPPELLGWKRHQPRPQIGTARHLVFEKSRGGYAGKLLQVNRDPYAGSWQFETDNRAASGPLDYLTRRFREVTDDLWRLPSEWHSDLELEFHERSLRRYLQQLVGPTLETRRMRNPRTGRLESHYRPRQGLRDAAKAMIGHPGDGMNRL